MGTPRLLPLLSGSRVRLRKLLQLEANTSPPRPLPRLDRQIRRLPDPVTVSERLRDLVLAVLANVRGYLVAHRLVLSAHVVAGVDLQPDTLNPTLDLLPS